MLLYPLLGLALLFTVSEGSDPCVDHYRGCASYDRADCNDTETYPFLKQHCKETCGLCPGAKPMCVDRGKTCAVLQSRGWCVSNNRQKFTHVALSCEETCGFCRGIPLEAPPETEQEARTCLDRKRNCDIRLKMGWCTDQSKYSFMKKYCKETCLFCAGMPK